jgi:hypothetical protein
VSYKRLVSVAFVCITLARVVCAEEGRKNEIGLLLGAAVTPAIDTGSQNGRVEIGNGVTFQATYARELIAAKAAGLYFEVPLFATPLQDVTASNGLSPTNYASLFITPGLRFKLAPGSSFAPWFSIGGGYARFDESALRLDGSPNTTRGTNRGAVQFGGGVDIRTPVRILFPIGLRAEVRDLYSGKFDSNGVAGNGFQHNMVFSGGIVVHF